MHDGTVLGAAGHRRFGERHAEAALLDSLDTVPQGSCLYSTLEPCTHRGKTPPCVERIIGTGIRRVVLAAQDPNPTVSGKGIRALEDSGIAVTCGVREKEYRWLNRAYFYARAVDAPWIDLKLALSADGFIAPESGESKWITGKESRSYGHRLRSQADAVMVGANTVRQDNPTLTDRHTGRTDQPRAIVVCRDPGTLPLDATLCTERADDTILLVPKNTARKKLRPFEDRGVTVEPVPCAGPSFDWPEIVPRLLEWTVGRVLVEGGGFLAGRLLEAGYVNELHLFYSGRIFGGGTPGFQLTEPAWHVKEAPDDHLLEHRSFEEDVYVRRLMIDPFRRAGLSTCIPSELPEWDRPPGPE